MNPTILITCEHAGNHIPESYADLFEDHEDVLNSHRGWDPGAHDIALYLSKHLNIQLLETFTSRLVVEANRSLDNPELFSAYTKDLSLLQKQKIIDTYYSPYRHSVEMVIGKSHKPVLHLSIHTFTPVLNDIERKVDIGLLFDPSRKLEQQFCLTLQKQIQLSLTDFQVQLNEPYKGTDDGFTTYLRTKFTDDDYAGIEIEINQKYTDTELWMPIKEALVRALNSLLV